MIEITTAPIDHAAVTERVRAPHAGGSLHVSGYRA